MNWQKLNPEKNQILRAYLYAMGFGGTVHVLTLFVISIIRDDFVYLNPMYFMDFIKLFGDIPVNAATFILGWLFFSLEVFVAYRLIRRFQRDQ